MNSNGCNRNNYHISTGGRKNGQKLRCKSLKEETFYCTGNIFKRFNISLKNQLITEHMHHTGNFIWIDFWALNHISGWRWVHDLSGVDESNRASSSICLICIQHPQDPQIHSTWPVVSNTEPSPSSTLHNPSLFIMFPLFRSVINLSNKFPQNVC